MTTCSEITLTEKDRMGSRLVCPKCGKMPPETGGSSRDGSIPSGSLGKPAPAFGNIWNSTLPLKGAFRVRSSFFTDERSYRLTEDALETGKVSGEVTRIPYEEIRSVNLQYYGMGGYRCVIKTPRIKLAPINRHYLGYNDFEDRNSAYASLMVGLHRKLKVHGRNVTFTSGANWLFYTGLFLNIGLLLAGIGWIWVMVRSEGLNLDSWLILLILPIVWAATFGITRLGRPKDYDPAAPPENMLPQQ